MAVRTIQHIEVLLPSAVDITGVNPALSTASTLNPLPTLSVSSVASAIASVVSQAISTELPRPNSVVAISM